MNFLGALKCSAQAILLVAALLTYDILVTRSACVALMNSQRICRSMLYPSRRPMSMKLVDVSQKVLGGVSPPSKQTSTSYSKDISESRDAWVGRMEGFDWELEKARRAFVGPDPGYAPFSMALWKPNSNVTLAAPNFLDQWKILLNNALQLVGLAESMDGAPLVQGVNTFRGNLWQLLSRVADGDLAQLAGGPLFLLLAKYYEQYGPVFKLAFGPKSFIVVSDPVMVKHILKESPMKYDKVHYTRSDLVTIAQVNRLWC